MTTRRLNEARGIRLLRENGASRAIVGGVPMDVLFFTASLSSGKHPHPHTGDLLQDHIRVDHSIEGITGGCPSVSEVL